MIPLLFSIHRCSARCNGVAFCDASAHRRPTQSWTKRYASRLNAVAYGKQSVIITVDPGYREALRLALSAHGDAVTGEFPAINAIAADDSLRRPGDAGRASARFARCRRMRSVGVSAAKDTKVLKKVLDQAAQALARQVEALAAKLLKKNAFATPRGDEDSRHQAERRHARRRQSLV